MLYDLAAEPPPPGSLLEFAFLLLTKRRQEAHYFQTQAIIASVLATVSKKDEALKEALDAFKDSLFPFLTAEKKKQDVDHKKILKHWTENVTAMKIRPVWRAEGQRGMLSKLRKGRQKVTDLEEERKTRKWRRI